MRPERAPRASWLLASTSAAALVCCSGAAVAECTGTALVNILASGGETCFVSGPFTSTAAGVIAGQATGLDSALTNQGEGFSSFSFSTSAANTPAVQADGGGQVTLNIPNIPPVTPPLVGTVTTTGAGSIGLLATGSGEGTTGPVASQINVTNLNVSTTGLDSFGAVATNGASMSLTGGSVIVSGDGSIGVNSNGAGSTVQASGVAVTTSGGVDSETGNTAVGVLAFNGGTITFAGGSVTTTGASADAVGSDGAGSSIALSGGTTILTTNNGSAGLVVVGSGAAATATGIAITTHGDEDTSDGFIPAGAYNGQDTADDFPNGGTMHLTNTVILTTGSNAPGVETNSGGVTTISGGSISTAGNGSYAVVAQSNGSISLSGTTISTTGNGSGGLGINGSGSEIDASGVTIATTGAMDPVTGLHSYGIYNGPFGEFTSGGVAKISNTTISTQGADMHGVVTSTGGTTTISGGSVTTSGIGAIGLFATLGGAISATGSATTSIATSGGVSPATGLGAYGVNADGAGSSIKLGSATVTTSGAGATGLFASDRASSGAAGTITAVGTLNVQTKNASASAVALQGNGATIAATGGGTITAAGTAIAFMGGTGQTATFDGFSIANLSGDLVFADPSTATLNFNATTANAGNNNLLNATGGSAIALNANASMLTGAIRTDAASTSNVNLTNNTTWNLTAPSTVTNLNVTHSIIVFAPPGSGGGFKTLTVNNYAGNGANIAMNVALGGSGSAGDQIIINGGKATGSTLLTINNVGGLGGQTSGAGIPLVLAKNGGSVPSDAFSLANTPMAGGFKYTLEETDNSFFLVSSPTATVGGITNSINNVAKAQQSQMITNRVLGSILLGATQQISCSSCGGGFASFGSFALGGQGRWSLSDNSTLIGGVSYNQYSASGITVYNAPTAAAALIYDFVNWGSSRPFFEVGAGLTPYEQVNTTRTYPNGNTTGFGYSTAIDRNAALFGRAGWVDRLTPIDEAAAYVDLGRSWMQTGGYSEQMTSINPFPATVPNGLATLNVTRLGAQYTHLFNGNIEVNVGAAVAYGFGAGAGAPFNVFQFGTIAPGAIADSAWFEYSGRVGYRFTDRLVVDAFLLGTAGGLAGNFVHGGVGVRYSF
jgi:Autochaperone Domain Type 1